MAEQSGIWRKQPPARRALAIVVSVLVNALVSAALLCLIHSTIDLPWLTPTLVDAVLLSRCDKTPSSVTRRACVEQIVTSVPVHASNVQLARDTSEVAH